MTIPVELCTDDGLIPCRALRWDAESLFIEGTSNQVYVEPLAIGVAEYLRNRQELWNCAQVRAASKKVTMRRACLFGVQFERALELLSKDFTKESICKTLFCRDDASFVTQSSLGIVGSLLAHASRSRQGKDLLITLETWEIKDAGSETFYIHGIFSTNQQAWIHLDGATMDHSEEEKKTMFNLGTKAVGINYAKHFRLDGAISTIDVVNIVNAFLPLDDLTPQYMQKLTAIKAASG